MRFAMPQHGFSVSLQYRKPSGMSQLWPAQIRVSSAKAGRNLAVYRSIRGFHAGQCAAHI